MSQELCTGLEKAPRRAIYRALGLSDADMAKPLIAVVSARSGIAHGSTDFARMEDAVKSGICCGGCTPVVVPIGGVDSGIAAGHAGMRYVLPTRELIADGVEAALTAHAFDGAVFIADGDSAAGMLMGAARVNIPSIFVTEGPMPSAKVNGKKAGLYSVAEGVGAVNRGRMSLDELTRLEQSACGSLGGDNGMGAANSLGCILEALGIALFGCGGITAGTSERIRLAKRTGEAICELVHNAVLPRMILTKRAFSNAVTLAAAIGASCDVVLHIIATAAECSATAFGINLDFIAGICNKTPLLCKLFPRGDADMCDFYRAGGVAAVLHELAKLNLVDGSAYTAACTALAEGYEHAHVTDEAIIKKSGSPLSATGGMAILDGTLAERGAVVNRVAVSKQLMSFTCKAKCFDCEEDAVNAIYSGKIAKGDAVVIRYEGPSGAPGMREVRAAAAAIAGMGLQDDVPIITDGRAPDGLCTVIAHVCPEAAESGSKLALAHDGDTIKCDIASGRLNLDTPAKELQARQKKLRPKDQNAAGMLLRYQNLTTDAASGAVLKKKF